MCSKISYDTKADAKADMAGMENQHYRKNGNKMYFYECRTCGNWHATKQRVKDKRNKSLNKKHKVTYL